MGLSRAGLVQGLLDACSLRVGRFARGRVLVQGGSVTFGGARVWVDTRGLGLCKEFTVLPITTLAFRGERYKGFVVFGCEGCFRYFCCKVVVYAS